MHIAVLAEPDSFHTRKWTSALLALGLKVTVFSFSEYQLPHVPCVQVKPRLSWRGKLSYFSYLSSGDRLREALLAHRIDIVNPIDVTPFGVWARRAGLHPIMAVAMGADILEYSPRDGEEVAPERLWSRSLSGKATWKERLQYPLKQWLFRREVFKALHAADMVSGDNRVLVDAMRQWFAVPAHKSYLNRWGVEPALFEMSEEQEQRIRQTYGLAPGQGLLLSPRGIKPIYQGDIILEAFAMLLRSGALGHTRVIMLSAGYAVPVAMDREAKALESAFPQFSLIREVIPREDMCLLWNFTDVFVSAPVYDGYSNALSEGRYIGAIPVVNDTPATREVMQDGLHGRVVQPFTPDNLALSIKEIWESLDQWKAHSARQNREWVEEEAMLSVNMQEFVHKAHILLEEFRAGAQKTL
ncbi:MAG: hypothetical protein NWR72_17290 [Bacteroidia bacterium]|nr:hypothetical protein [Bacteroidia bacterium]